MSFWKNKKVLVTGGKGFIGSYVSKELLHLGAAVTITTSNKNSKSDIKGIKIISADLTNFDHAVNAAKNQDIILNFAAMDGGKIFKEKHGAEIFKTNTQICINVLESSRINNIKRVLIMSSSEINSIDYLVDNEAEIRSNYSQLNGYTWSKKFSEILGQIYNIQYGLKVIIVRPVNIYGPGDSTGIYKGRVIPTFIIKALANEDIYIMTSNNNKKYFIYVDDLVHFLIDRVENYNKTEPISVLSDKKVDIETLAKKIINITGSKSKIIKQKNTKDENLVKISKNNSSSSKIIKYSIKSSLDNGLINTVEFYKNKNA